MSGYETAGAFCEMGLLVAAAVARLNRATQQIRHVARGLDPIDIEACGLTAALDRLVRDTESLEQVRCGITFSRSELPLAPSANLRLYRIGQEALICHRGPEAGSPPA